MKKTLIWILWIALGVALLFIPKIFGIYYTNFFVSFAIMAVFSQSLNIELGYARLLNFAPAMFFGTGGYGTALALQHIPGYASFRGRFMRYVSGRLIGPDFIHP